jgi:hypothetical protein
LFNDQIQFFVAVLNIVTRQSVIAAMLALLALCACTTVPVDERATVRQEIDQAADEAIATLIDQDPSFQQSIDASVGYFVSSVSATKVPVVGGGYGIGVLYEKEAGSRTYMNITRFDLGAGLGAGKFRVLVLFENREVIEQFRGGTWKSGIGAESSAGTRNAGRYSTAGDGFSVHFSSEAGASLVASARLIRLSVNHDLSSSGLSDVSVPNIGFDAVDDQGEDASRVWDRALPFFAQKVVDEGYDLPFPYGVGLIYANVDQEMFLDGLQVGINGADQEPFDFVEFQNASANNDTLQFKADAWLFPFMNIFGLVGKLEGKAPMDVILDGNGMLDQLGTDCSGIVSPPLCGLLEDKTFTLPIEAPFSGKTYGVGTVLAGGWNNWFVALPISVTYADMDTTETDGTALTVTPRFGRVLNLGRKGNLALYAGGNYLEADFTVTGQVSTPDGLLTIDYTIDQSNKDRWNALLGFNWDINRHLSWSAEYNGFTGSREALISSISWRF